LEARLPRLLDGTARIYVATSNPGKVREIRAVLAALTPAQIVALGAQRVRYPEEGLDYEANAIGKARAVADALGAIAIGDDSGLEVEVLGGRPGVHSARYGGEGLDDRARVALLLRELRELCASREPSASTGSSETDPAADTDRAARFVCHVALTHPGGPCFVAEGACRGVILPAPRGEGGFGYDPVFRLQGEARTMAELASDEKNRVSHRANALRALFEDGAMRRG